MSSHSDNPSPRANRLHVEVPATVGQGGGHSIECASENLSRTGVLLTGRLTDATVDRVDLTLKTQSGSLKIQLVGRVVRVEPGPTQGERRIAVEFIDMDDGKRDALEVFLSRALESHPPAPLDALKPGASSLEVKKVLESIPLPQRINLAQRAELRQREFLRQDQHPAVLETLVRNSSLTLPEARAIAASAFLQPGTIDLLAGDLRFRNDEELRMLLATHPRVSMPTAEKLTADFVGPQLKRLLARPGLGPLLREKLFRKLTRG